MFKMAFSMPMVLFRALITGATALVVQEPFDMIWNFEKSESLMPDKTVLPSWPSTPLAGAVMITFLLPAVM